MKASIPFQFMPEDVPLQVIRLNDFFNPESLRPHRHAFFMLLWSTQGTGIHCINHLKSELVPGRVFFTHEGQVHQVIRYPQDGWIILFKHQLFKQYLDRYPEQEQSGIYDYFNREPFVGLEGALLERYNQNCLLLSQEAADNPNSRVLINYLAILLFHAYQTYHGTGQFIASSLHTEQLRKLKILIDQHYKTQRKAPFYSNLLGLSTRKLNEITMRVSGKLVNEMIMDRLLSESEAMLGGTNKSMKEIIFELDFINHSHFAYFFKKAKGMTPSAFRKQILDFNPNEAS
jgi:AraC family transcriptional activator of pobA